MADANSKRADKGQHDGPDHGPDADAAHETHSDTGQHAKKKTERAPVADDGPGMSRYDSPRQD